MPFENLVVSRIVIHEVFKRRPGNQITQPHLATQMATLAAGAMDVFRTRVTDAIGSASQSMAMDILPPTADSAIRAALKLNEETDVAGFVATSTWFPNKLTQVQTSQQYPGGIVVVFDGTVGHPARKFVGIIKAEMSSGFRPTDTMQIDYIEKMFLGDQTKLYKIGVFVRPAQDPPTNQFPGGWEATVYDRNILGDRGAAARYFYGEFLGCEIPPDAASLTRQFFNLTRKFIKTAPLDDEEKIDVYQALHTYLKADQAPTIQVATFSDRFFPAPVRNLYSEFMAAEQFPTNAIAKDTSEITKQLERRRISFARGVQLTGTAEAFDDYVKVESIPPEGEDADAERTWTRITVKDRIRQQE